MMLSRSFNQTLTGLAICGALIMSTNSHAQSAPPAESVAQQAPAKPADWKETYAYSVGMQALVYGYPVSKNLLQRYFMVKKPMGVVDAPVNGFFHVRRAGTSDDKYGSSISDDILYSVGWYDVKKEPLVLSVPDAGARYLGIQMMEMYSDIHNYVGSRATGGKAASYLVVGPQWQGDTPKGIAGVLRSPTPTGLLLLRIDFDNRDNLGAIHALQDGVKLSPLSHWQAGKPFVASDREVLQPFPPGSDPLWLFRNINRGMTENPPPADHAVFMTAWRSVGIGPAMSDDFSSLDLSIRAGLQRAQTDGLAMLTQAAKSGFGTKVVNNWAYGQANWGRTAAEYDFLTRAGTQSLAGMQEHHVEEVVKLRAHMDGGGAPLNGADRNYVIRFAKEQIPLARAFWAVTVYDEKYDLVANPISRFSLGAHDKATLKTDADGSLTFYLQADAPAADKTGNWLPVPKGPFNLFLRAYLPDESLIKQTYAPPPVERVR